LKIITKLPTQQSIVRDEIKELFDIAQDDEFRSHAGVSYQEVRAYQLGEGDGPDANNLQMDLGGHGLEKAHGFLTKWNEEVVGIVLERVQIAVDDEDEFTAKPSTRLLRLLVEEKCKILRGHGRILQPRYTEVGERETEQEVESRVLQKDSEDAKRRRKAERVYTVSGLVELRGDGTNCRRCRSRNSIVVLKWRIY